MLNKCFPDIMNVGFTADMETKLDKIEEGGQRLAGRYCGLLPGI